MHPIIPDQQPPAGTPRHNPHLGIDCPPWCITDHAERFSSACVSRAYGARSAWACAVRDHVGVCVAIDGIKDGTSAELRLSAKEAQQLAALSEMAGAGELAAAIRQAAADVTEAGQ